MSKHVKIGVFVPNAVQFLDIAAVDVLGVMSREYMSAITFLPAHVAASAPEVSVFYITTPTMGSHIPATSGMNIKATHFYTDAEVAPGKLDIVVVPGPDPSSTFEEGGLRWLKAQAGAAGTDVLSVCTGIMICAEAGITEGKSVSGPRGMQDELKKRFPGMKLVGENLRWAQDGNFWSSGGVTNGNDMMAAYARTGKHWPLPLVEIGLSLLDVGDRGRVYGESRQAFMLGFAWQLLKGWFGSFGAKKAEKQG